MSIVVSVVCCAYNHERYIRKCIDGFLMQRTNFKFEVLINDDASTDGTADIIREYENNYPEIIKPVYQRENQYSKGIMPINILIGKAKGKYIAFCEGDDFWIDEHKLQKQIDFLENHSKYTAVAHNCVVVGEDSLPNGEKYPECYAENYTFKDYMHGVMPGQLATFVMKNYLKENYMDSSIFEKGFIPGDQILYFAQLAYGKIYCIQETMSAYRYIINGGGSFTANYTYDAMRHLEYREVLLIYADNAHNKTAEICAGTLYLFPLIHNFYTKNIDIKEFFIRFKSIKYKWRCVKNFLWAYIKKLMDSK